MKVWPYNLKEAYFFKVRLYLQVTEADWWCWLKPQRALPQRGGWRLLWVCVRVKSRVCEYPAEEAQSFSWLLQVVPCGVCAMVPRWLPAPAASAHWSGACVRVCGWGGGLQSCSTSTLLSWTLTQNAAAVCASIGLWVLLFDLVFIYFMIFLSSFLKLNAWRS